MKINLDINNFKIQTNMFMLKLILDLKGTIYQSKIFIPIAISLTLLFGNNN